MVLTNPALLDSNKEAAVEAYAKKSFYACVSLYRLQGETRKGIPLILNKFVVGRYVSGLVSHPLEPGLNPWRRRSLPPTANSRSELWTVSSADCVLASGRIIAE
jgi:hypothetical protein